MMISEDGIVDKETESFLWGGTTTGHQHLLTLRRRTQPNFSDHDDAVDEDDVKNTDETSKKESAQEKYWKKHNIAERQQQAMEQDVSQDFLDRLDRDIFRAVRIGQNEAIMRGRMQRTQETNDNLPALFAPISTISKQEQQFPPIFVPMSAPEDVSIGGGPCLICEEIIAKTTWKEVENVRQTCCGTLICWECSMLNTDYCPVCQASRPTSEQVITQQTLQFAQNHKAWAQYQYARYLSQNHQNMITKPYIRRRAITWAELAAQRGYTPAYGLLAKIYDQYCDDRLDPTYFEGDPTSKEKAFSFYLKAAKLGNDARAQHWLNTYYEKEGDYEQALHWAQQAANQDYPPAQESMGDKYLMGHGVPISKERAKFWFQKVDAGIHLDTGSYDDDSESSAEEFILDENKNDGLLFETTNNRDGTGISLANYLLDDFFPAIEENRENYGLFGYGDPLACKDNVDPGAPL
jgi:tetratricopeptide (TPR) repeat protein